MEQTAELNKLLEQVDNAQDMGQFLSAMQKVEELLRQRQGQKEHSK